MEKGEEYKSESMKSSAETSSSESSSDDEQDRSQVHEALAKIAQNGKSVFLSTSNSNLMTSTSAIPIPLSPKTGISKTIFGMISPKLYNQMPPPDGEPIKLPESLESLPKSDHFPNQRHRWNTNEEIASMLIAFDRHHDWLSKEVKIRPKSGSMLLYSRKKVRYRRDGYCWKKRKDGKTTREDHMKLKVQGMECIYGCYVHSAILPTFHRRCYWLLQNPDIVLVHYLNVPYPDDNKMVVASSVSLWSDKKEWTKEELISQLKPMFFSEEEPDLNNELEISTAETVESIVTQLMDKQRAARAAALNKQLECGCPDSTNPEKVCGHVVSATTAISATGGGSGRVKATKSEAHTTSGGNGSSMRAPSSRNGRNNRHLMNMQHRLQQHEGGANHFYKTNDRYYPQGSSYPQVSSTTGNLDSRHSPAETPSPQNQQMNPGHHLVLSVSQVQTSRGLVILNSQNDPHYPHHMQQNGLTPLMNSQDHTQQQQHNTPRTEQALASTNGIRSNSDSMDNNSAVSSAVRSLTSLSDFHLDSSHNGNYDNYSVTDTLLSETRREEEEQRNNSSTTAMVKNHHHQQEISGGYHAGVNGPLLDFKSAFSDLDGGKHSELGFFHDSLDANHHENTPAAAAAAAAEIQRSLALHAQHQHQNELAEGAKNQHHRGAQHHPVDLNPMDFIEHDVVNAASSSGSAGHPPTPSANAGSAASAQGGVNQFGEVNLDAFEMLNEFNDLNYHHVHHQGPPPLLASNGPAPMLASTSKTLRNNNINNNNNGGEMVHITEYSPEWAWAEGGQKMLVIGPWFCTEASYQILFDGSPCDTTLVQNGVLKCITPAHRVGMVRVEVAYDGYVISKAVNYEYKPGVKTFPTPTTTLSGEQQEEDENNDKDEERNKIDEQNLFFNTEDNCEKSCERLWKFTLMEKVENMADEMIGADFANDGVVKIENRVTMESNVMEEVLVSVIEKIMRTPHQRNESELKRIKPNLISEVPDISLLHLAASLGFTRLICSLLHFVAESSPVGSIITDEVNTRAQDYEGFTPLMRACLNGHSACALYLYRSDPVAYKILNYDGESCHDLSAPHEELCTELQRLEKLRILSETSANSRSGIEFLKPGLISRKPSRTASLDENQQSLFLRSSSSSSCSSSKSAVASRPLSSSGAATATSNNDNPNPNAALRSNRSASPKNLNQPLSVTVDQPGVYNCRHGLLMSKRSSFDSGINLFSNSSSTENKKDAKTVAKNGKYRAFSSSFSQSSCDTRPDSPIIDVEGLSDEDEGHYTKHAKQADDSQQQPQGLAAAVPSTNLSNLVLSPKQEVAESEEQKVLNLAEQFIAAMPDRIKNESDLLQQEEEPMLICNSPAASGVFSGFDASQSDDLGVESLCDDLDFDFDFNFDLDGHGLNTSSLSSHNNNNNISINTSKMSSSGYRDSPHSSLSADESSCIHSPASYTLDTISSPGGSCTLSVENGASPPGTTADLQEFLQASLKCERDLSNLTLSDHEQRELYEAAQIIQKAYRSYKGRKKANNSNYQEKEAKAAVVIQNYYRRYKTYLYWKQMARAATLIQNKYRTYCEHKRFKKSQEAATCIQNYYRTYKEHQSKPRSSRESTPSNGLKRTYSQRRQHQAAKKIQQFMRKTHLKLRTERGFRTTVAGVSRVTPAGAKLPLP